MAIFEGSLLGDGGARKAAGCGLGARFLDGEKCCCSVENGGLLSSDSTCTGREACSSVDPRAGGGRVVDAVRTVEEDFVRARPGSRVAADMELADALRRCREVVGGGLARSFFSGSIFEGGLGWRIEEDLCKDPVVVGLLMLARGGGGGIEEEEDEEEALLVTLLPLELGSREDTVARRVIGLTGSRLED